LAREVALYLKRVAQAAPERAPDDLVALAGGKSKGIS
jgi:hypothetical protein